MIQLKTPVHFSIPFPFDSMEQRFASIGSCFSEKAVRLLSDAGFQCCSNPNGIIYNPVSIANAVSHITENIPYTGNDIFPFGGKFHSREHHGSFSGETEEETIRNAEQTRKTFADFLSVPCPVALTFGTAVVFREKQTGRIAANCHKVPGTAFTRELLPFGTCCQTILESVQKIISSGEHPVLLSVSPVRHHPGDPVLNTRSKALLIGACHQAVEAFPGKCFYFPAYELLNDELRDYRFYDDDLVHPSRTAEQIILESFIRGCYPGSAEKILLQAETTRKRNAHVPGGIR